MSNFLAVMTVPIMVAIDTDCPTPEQRRQVEAALATDLRSNGYGGGTLADLLVGPKEPASQIAA